MNNVLKKPIDPDDVTAGTIEYQSNQPIDDAAGFFVTTYYFRDSDCTTCNDFKGQDSPWVKTDVYKIGLLHYLGVTEQPEFKGWKLIIYLDKHSLENPTFRNTNNNNNARLQKHQQEWDKIFSHPNVVFGVVDFPEYAVGNKGDEKTIDNAILRSFRMKAFMDFPDVPVFVRDADTLFENLIKGGEMTTLADFTVKLALWEKTLWDNLVPLFSDPSPYKILIASQPNYHRQWHTHPETGTNTTGCYAAITSSLGNFPEMTDGSIWRACLAYLRQTCKVVQVGQDRNPNNLQKPTYIGKDEQFLSYVMMPMVFDRIYFYYFEYIQVEGGRITNTPETPFAGLLLQQGLTQYPSPYKTSLGEPTTPPTEGKRKDENVKTETTLLNPAIIPMSLSDDTNNLMKTIFQYYIDTIAAAKAAPNFVDRQLGGGNRRGGNRKKTRRRPIKRRKHRSHKRK